MHGRGGPVGHMALALVASFVAHSCAAGPRSTPASTTNACNWHLTSPAESLAGMQILSATTEAWYSLGTSSEGKPRGYVLVARGRPNWFVGQLVGGGGHVNEGHTDHIWRVGNLSYKVIYDPKTNTANLLGHVV